MDNKSKSLIIFMTMLLLKATHHKTSLVSLMRAIRSSLDLIDSLASNMSHLRWQRNKIRSTDALQSGDILNHGMLPIRMDNSLSVGGRLNQSSNSEAIGLQRT